MSKTYALIYFLLSVSIVYSVHLAILYRQRHDRKLTISDHAINSPATHLFYLVFHLIGFTFYGLFAYEFYYKNGYSYLYYMTLAICVLDIMQAILPARNRTNKIHIVTAYCMGLLTIITATLASIVIDYDYRIKILTTLLIGAVFMVLIKTMFVRKKVYIDQMIMVLLIDIVLMLTLLFAR